VPAQGRAIVQPFSPSSIKLTTPAGTLSLTIRRVKTKGRPKAPRQVKPRLRLT